MRKDNKISNYSYESILEYSKVFNKSIRVCKMCQIPWYMLCLFEKLAKNFDIFIILYKNFSLKIIIMNLKHDFKKYS